MRRSGRVLLLAVLAMALTAGNAGAADLEPLRVGEDAQFDHDLWKEIEPSATPGAFDLKGVLIGETDTTIDFVWEFWDIPDGSGGLFEGNYADFEFSLDDNDGIVDPVMFSLTARARYPLGVGVHVHCDVPGVPVFGDCTGVGPGGGVLSSNCTVTGTVTSCQPVPGSLVTVQVDDVANTLTAKVRRLDLRDADNNFVAVDGSALVEQDLWQGIVVCQGAVLIFSFNCDFADFTMNVDEDTGAYILGQPR